MKCKNCNSTISIKNTDKWISLLCTCEMLLVYPNKVISTITKKEYKKEYKIKEVI